MRATAVLIWGFLLALSGGAEAQEKPPLFDGPWRAFDVADYPAFAPVAIVKGDVDGDGHLDIVAGREFFNPGISVLRANGDGTFAEEELYNLSNQQYVGDVALADIDGDGDLDVLASIPGNAGTDFRFAYWRNNGGGTYGSARLYETGDGPVGIVVADFTGDGFPDIMTADNGYVAGTNNTVSLVPHNTLSGDAAGFGGYRSFTSGDNSKRIEAADLDGDGDLDIAVGRGDFANNGDHGISVLFNDGTGNFAGLTVYENTDGSYRESPAVHLADMNNDGHIDLLAGGGDAGDPPFGNVTVRLNDGTGAFGPLRQYLLAEYSFTPHHITTADLDGNGWRDIIVSTPSGRTIDGFNVLLSDGKGDFGPAVFYMGAKQTRDLETMDVEGDGDLDVLTVANDSSVVTVHRNRGAGAFLILGRTFVHSFLNETTSGDIDLDGDVDFAYRYGDLLYVFANEGKGFFSVAAEIDVGNNSALSIDLLDLSGDGAADLAVATEVDFQIFQSNRDGSFATPIRVPVDPCGATGVAMGDFDNDGDIDIAIADRYSCNGGYKISIIRNEDTKSYALHGVHPMSGPMTGLETADVNNDGNPDLLTRHSSSGVSVIPGNGDLTFQNNLIPSGEVPAYWGLGDADDDGNIDLFMVMPQDSFGLVTVALARGYGDGSFQFREEYPGPNGREGAFRITNQIDVADINGDGFDDLITTNNAPNDVSIFLANADGTLSPQDRYGVWYSPSHSLVADFTGDGALDIATVIALPPYGFVEAMVVLPNTGAPSKGDTVLTGFQIVTGSLLDGELSDLLRSDDARVRIRSGFGETFTELHKMEMVVSAVTTVDSPATIDLTIESFIDEPNGTARIRLFNWNTGDFEQVGQYSIGTTELVRSIEGIDAADYISGSGEIDLSIKHLVFVPFLAFTFESFIDWVEVDVRG